jgi:DNA-binding CsgD family transcriptional regulator
MLNRPGFAPTRRDDATLSPRELTCLTWIAQGKTAWEVAQILGITERTVTAHLTSAVTKLGAANRLQAAVIAVREGLIS